MPRGWSSGESLQKQAAMVLGNKFSTPHCCCQEERLAPRLCNGVLRLLQLWTSADGRLRPQRPSQKLAFQAPSSSWKVIDFSGSPQFTLGFWLLAVLPQCSLWARARSPTSGGSWGEVAYTVILTGIGEGKASRRAGVCLTGGVSQTLTD